MEYYKQLYANKLDNLDKYKILERQKKKKLSKLIQEGMENLNISKQVRKLN